VQEDVKAANEAIEWLDETVRSDDKSPLDVADDGTVKLETE